MQLRGNSSRAGFRFQRQRAQNGGRCSPDQARLFTTTYYIGAQGGIQREWFLTSTALSKAPEAPNVILVSVSEYLARRKRLRTPG